MQAGPKKLAGFEEIENWNALAEVELSSRRLLQYFY